MPRRNDDGAIMSRLRAPHQCPMMVDCEGAKPGKTIEVIVGIFGVHSTRVCDACARIMSDWPDIPDFGPNEPVIAI